MSGVTLSNDAARNAAVDFSEPLYMDTQVISYKRPVLEADIAGFIKPYDTLMWILLAASMLVVLVAIFGVHVKENSLLFRRNNEVIKETPKLDSERKDPQQQKWESVWYSFQWTIGSTLAQSIPWVPRGSAVRVIAGLWLFSALIIASVYRSNLKAMLILPKLRLPFDSMEELVETDIPCNVPKGSMLYQAVLYAPPGSLLSRLKDQLVDSADADKGVQNLVLGVNAIFIGKSIIEFVAHHTFSQSNVPVSASYQTFQYPVLLGGTNCNVSIYSGAPTPIPRSSQVVPIVMSRSSRGNQLRYLVLLRWYQLQYLALLRDMKCISRSFQGYQLQCLAPLRDMKCNTSFFSGIPTARPLLQIAVTRTCPLYIASQTFFGATSLGLGFKKGSPLKAKVNPILRNLKEFGILDYLVRRETLYAKECLKQESLVGSAETLRPLKLKDFYGVFSLYAAGTFLASVVFLTELILRRKRRT
ncbi:Variant Ionotropic Glutamate Receptor [Penaeus vannamei]|uniref:Variant Ionotropic Glutamate Receptor n=1 Tax=Penaeus vannamei TaxID=6689 RepID=A0A423T8Y3_PENVA|nr:Variant Ionotropic Glutamate Receptor [Penaeus vannamei]